MYFTTNYRNFKIFCLISEIIRRYLPDILLHEIFMRLLYITLLLYDFVTGVGQRRKSRSARMTASARVKNSKKPVNDRSGGFYLPAGIARRCAMKNTRRAPGRPRSLATVADDSSSGMARSVTRVQLGASQRSWHGALFRLGETRFEEGRGNGRGSGIVIRRLNLKYLERYVDLPCGDRPWSPGSGKIYFRSYGNGILRHESVE